MDTVLTVLIVLAATAGIARSIWLRIARRSEASCASGCEGCALAASCGAASASGGSPRSTAGVPSPRESGAARRVPSR